MKYLVSLLVAASCCGRALERTSVGIEATKFEATYTDLKGEEKDVPTDKPLVIAYSGSFCSACNVEVADWANYLKSKDPVKVKIMTLSVSDNVSATSKWKNKKGASWEFGVANQDDFDKYCSENLIPCVLVVKNGQVVKKYIGAHGHAALEQYSGKWE